MRIIVHTGKGGTGKTSISAATALRCAEAGLKTLVISTDTAHSLADSFERDIGPEPVAICDNLWAQEVDVRHSMDKYWGDIQQRLLRMFRHQELEELVAGEVTILPGLEEGAHLLWINHYYEQDDYDVLIVDAAPTAETLRLLSLPGRHALVVHAHPDAGARRQPRIGSAEQGPRQGRQPRRRRRHRAA